MKSKAFSLLLLVMSSMIFFSCSKDDDPPQKKTRRELIVGSWIRTGFTETPAVLDYNGDGTKDSDAFPYLQACAKDNITTFKANSEFEYDEGPTKCSPTAPQTQTGINWLLSTDEQKLFVTAIPSTILELDENTMKLSGKASQGSENYTVVSTYTRIK